LRRLKIELELSKCMPLNQDIYGLELYHFERKLLELLTNMNCTLGTGQPNKKEVS